MIKIQISNCTTDEIVIGEACCLPAPMEISPSQETICQKDEIIHFQQIKQKVATRLNQLASTQSIFSAHVEIANDETLSDAVIQQIENGIDCYRAIERACTTVCHLFDEVEDEYLKQRQEDIRDVCLYWQKELRENRSIHPTLPLNAILVAHNLTAADAIVMDENQIKGFITANGGATSHLCILAKSKGIAAIVGAREAVREIHSGDRLILDGQNKLLFINPDEEISDLFRKKQKNQLLEVQEAQANKEKAALTQDQHPFGIYANAASLKEVEFALQQGAQGIGLLRSEGLYMNSNDFPSEQEQFDFYQQAALLCGDKALTIRTLDIGGDKELPYYKWDKEMNPFLGWRAIRISLSLKDVFRTQLKAILRASAAGNIQLMFPMIVTLSELREAKAILEQCKQELIQQKIPFRADIPVGMMVETPASVFMAREFAHEVDFFSIGTNDLTQYILATDRTNEKTAYLYNSLDPAVLRAICWIIESAHREQRTVCICGDFADRKDAISLLLGMNLDSISIPGSSIPKMKQQVRQLNYAQCKLQGSLLKEKATLAEVKKELAR